MRNQICILVIHFFGEATPVQSVRETVHFTEEMCFYLMYVSQTIKWLRNVHDCININSVRLNSGEIIFNANNTKH